ncbi:MAG: hypothetical protein IKP78_08910 [Ruminococcus sp.]|nr:hypothetical protein [Ruminococcus sp.]
MKTNKIAIALLCAAVCAGVVSCNGDDSSSSSRKATYVTAQENETTEAKKSDYVQVSIDGLDVLYTGWIKMPTGKEYISIMNAPNDKYQNGFAYPDFPAEVYKEEGEWLLIKTNGKVGYIPKTNFTTEAPAVEGHVEN